ncbi:MAG: DNA translocase FtsK [Oscillospiraceae bacterium]|nr:DNA translocase FtsK [Oscillospiraceae bacterium]
MASAKSKKDETRARQTGAKKSEKTVPGKKPIRREIGATVCLFLGLFSFLGYFIADAWLISILGSFLKGLFGWGFFLFPPAFFVCSVLLLFRRSVPQSLRITFVLLLPVTAGAIIHLFVSDGSYKFSSDIVKALYISGAELSSGGVVSGIFSELLISALSIYGALPLLLAMLIFFALGALNISPEALVALLMNRRRENRLPERDKNINEPDENEEIKNEPLKSTTERRSARRAIDIPLDEGPAAEYTEEHVGFFNVNPRVKTPDQVLSGRLTEPEKQTGEETARHIADEQKPKKKEINDLENKDAGNIKPVRQNPYSDDSTYEIPPTDLLRAGKREAVDAKEEIALNRERLDSTLRSFGVSASITGVTRGPTVTRYDLSLDAGVKLTKLTNLAGDLALSLGVTSVRIAPIPDKISTVGVEVPNKLVSLVCLRNIIESPAFKNSASKLTFAIGEDIGGNPIVGNIAKLPHMLIAGTTGSGKSVCMNSLILSLLFKASPEEVRLVMIDPKMVELGIYNGIPHLFIPIVTDPKKAAGALQWAVVEMLKRYRQFSEIGARDLTGYNSYQRKNDNETIPQVVIVIDELADLMLTASKEVEESICRIAQMGRASGIHLIIATQRPSADVITGLMKANIPSRIAFAVSSALESRIILDTQGADKLIGSGDMLYSPLGSGKPMRIQGAFVSDEEREEVINFVKSGNDAQYNIEIMAEIEKAAANKASLPSDNAKPESEQHETGYDELLPQAVDVIFETKQASVSMLQRRLKLGYSRAARLVDQMEEIGVVGPFEGSKPRQIMITKQEWQEMQFIHGTVPRESFNDISFIDVEESIPQPDEYED